MQHGTFVTCVHLLKILTLVSLFLLCSEYCLHVKLKPSYFKATAFCRNQPGPLPAACRCWSVQQLWWDAQCCVLVSKVSVMLGKNHCLGDTHSQPGSLGPYACKVDRQVLCTWSQLERMLLNSTKDRSSTKAGKMASLSLYTILQGHVNLNKIQYLSIGMKAKPVKITKVVINLNYPFNMVGHRWSNRTFLLL